MKSSSNDTAIANKQDATFFLSSVNLFVSAFAFLVLFIAPTGSQAQLCGDSDCDGTMTIADLSAAIDYGYISFSPPGCQRAYEFDHHLGLNISDRLEFPYCLYSIESGYFCGDCSTLGPPLVPQLSNENLVSVVPSTVPAYFSDPLTVSLVIKIDSGLKALQLPFRVLIGTQEAQVVRGTLSTTNLPALTLLPTIEANNIIVPHGVGSAPAGRYKLLQFQISAPLPPSPDPMPISMELVTLPQDSAYYPLLIYGELPQRTYLSPTVASFIPCCVDQSGNVDCDLAETTDIADLSALIDNLYISFSPLCCKQEANCDGSPDGAVDIADLSALIDYLYISFSPTAFCL